MADRLGAFVDYPFVAMEAAGGTALAGLTFAVKDIIDVAGHPTGCGHPLKREQSPIATASASVVDALAGAGARFVGKTHTDELAYSLNGENIHYGTPVNPAADGRIPGGSSSGSASATAGRLADIGVGTDTGGSVRAPASFCGLFGIRTTHGAIPMDRIMPLAPSYDTLGWFARDAEVLARVGEVLLPAAAQSSPPERILIARDAFGMLDPPLGATFHPALEAIAAAFGGAAPITLMPNGWERGRAAFRDHQAYEAWRHHGAWIERFRPSFGPGIAERFAYAATVTEARLAAAQAIRAEIARRLDQLLEPGVVVLLPTAPGIAPRRGTPPAELETFRSKALELLCLAGHAGLPQVSIPGLTYEGCPLGLSILGRRGSDRTLIALAGRIALLLP